MQKPLFNSSCACDASPGLESAWSSCLIAELQFLLASRLAGVPGAIATGLYAFTDDVGAQQGMRSGPCCVQLSRRRSPQPNAHFNGSALPGSPVLNHKLNSSAGAATGSLCLSTVCTSRPLPAPQDTQHVCGCCSRCGEWAEAQPEAWPVHDGQGCRIRVCRAALLVPLPVPLPCATHQLGMLPSWAGELQQSAAPFEVPPAPARPPPTACLVRLPALIAGWFRDADTEVARILSSQKNYYYVLKVKKDTPSAEIKANYFKLRCAGQCGCGGWGALPRVRPDVAMDQPPTPMRIIGSTLALLAHP